MSWRDEEFTDMERGLKREVNRLRNVVCELEEENTRKFEEGYDKAINDIMHIIDEADDNANAMYLLGQFIIERKLRDKCYED